MVVSPHAFAANVCENGNHNYTIKSIKPATSDSDGQIVYICSKCELTYTKVLLASSKKEWEIVYPPTCTASGLVKHHFSANNNESASKESELITIPQKGHSYSVEILDSTCTKKGYKKFYCNDCGDTFTETEPALGHSYVDVKKDGVTVSECQRCGDIYQDGVTANAPLDAPDETVPDTSAHVHSYRVYKRVDPTCEEEGSITYKCKACSDSYTEVVSPTGHNYGDFEVVRNPSFTHQGLLKKTCKNDKTHIITEKTARVISFKVTPAVVVTASINLIVIIVFAVIIFSDIYVVIWDSNKRKKLKIKILEERKILLKKLHKGR